MKSIKKGHIRSLIALNVIIIFFLGGLGMMEANNELTGTLLFLGAIGVIIYSPLLVLLKRKKLITDLQAWNKKEIWWLILMFEFICLVGALESYNNHWDLTLLFIILFIAVIVLTYLVSRFSAKKNSEDVNKLNKSLKIVFTVGAGIILVVIEARDFELIWSFSAFFYFLIIFYWGVRWFIGQIKTTINLKTEKNKTELTHLQSQVNPHFFFNTLNNLYGLIDKDSTKAKDMVLKLSDMMRYSIYDGQKALVSLEEELEYLGNYIELHKARYHKKTDIKFHHHIQHEGIEVMPLLFIILLENAFKHGVENLRDNAYVNVNLIANDSEISFAVENNFDNDQIPESNGIGLKNLHRRLELVYPKRHTLSFSATNDVYKAQLTLKLE